MEEIRKTLINLGLSDAEVILYLCLLEFGALGASELVRRTQTKRPTTYYALRQLIDRGLVAKSGAPGVEKFRAAPVESLLTIVDQKKYVLEDLRKKTVDLLPSLSALASPLEGLPAVAFYEGDRAMKQAINESLYCRDKKIDFLTPHDNFFWQTSDQLWADHYIEERNRRNIKTRHLWERVLDDQTMTSFSFPLEHIRILPKKMSGHFQTTLLLFDDKTMYISSKKDSYVLVVRSKEHRSLLSAMFEVLWDSSVPAKEAIEQAPETRKNKKTS